MGGVRSFVQQHYVISVYLAATPLLNGVKLKTLPPILSLDIYEINGLCTKMNTVVE